MLLKSLTLAVAGLTVGCAALMLPPEISEADIAIAEAIPFEAIPPAQSQAISLDCPGCPVQVRNRQGHVKTKNGKHSHLELSFTIDHQSNDRLLVNDFELYPNSDPFHNVLSVPQVLDKKEKSEDEPKKERKRHHKQQHDGDGDEKLKSHHKGPGHRQILPSQLGFSLQIHPEAKAKDQQFDLIGLDLQIIEVGNTFINGIPNVHVKLIKDAAGNLMIASIETTASQTLQTTPTDQQGEECTTLLCKWLSLVKDRLTRLKGKHCGGNGGKTAHGPAPESGDRPHGFSFHHQGRHGHLGQHAGGSHHRSWSHLFRNIASHIMLPILIGVVAGVSVSLIGMVVGSVVVALWRTFFRRPGSSSRRRASHAHHKVSQETASEEKLGLMEHQDPPPSYEEQTSDEDVKKVEV